MKKLFLLIAFVVIATVSFSQEPLKQREYYELLVKENSTLTDDIKKESVEVKKHEKNISQENIEKKNHETVISQKEKEIAKNKKILKSIDKKNKK